MSRSLMEALESRTLLAAIGDAANDEGAPRPHVIDLMVLYTPAAATDPGGVVALNRRVRREVADTNQILANSLIDITIRLVHVGEVQHEEPADGDIGVSLAELSSRADVQAVREQYGADLVTFWLATGFAGGMAYLPGPPGSPAPGNGFNVVVDSSANNDFTLAHELGHNLGAIHGGAIKFRVDETAMWPYTDVMGSWDPVPFYSNPHVSFHGVPLGIEGRRDNASTMRAHAPDVASYMPTRVTADAPPIASLGTVRLQKTGRRLTFDVRLLDDVAIDVRTLSSGDFTVSGLKGFAADAQLVKVDRATNGAARTATYRVPLTSPARSPGRFKVYAGAGAVADVAGNALAAGRVRVRLAAFPDLAGNGGNSAYDFGNIVGQHVRLTDEATDNPGSGVENVYRFELDRPALATVSLEGPLESQRLFLYRDSNGDESEFAEDRIGRVKPNGDKLRLSRAMGPGTYFLVMEPPRGAMGEYTVEVSAVPA